MDISISSNPMDVGKFWVYNPHTEICTIYPYDSLFAYGYDSTDVILNNVKGKSQMYPKHNCILPDSLFTMDFSSWSVADTFYLDVIEWKNLRNYPLDIIRKKNLFERRIITKNDFRTMTDDFFSGYMYEYMGNP